MRRYTFPLIECFQNIPCNPCSASCPQKAITTGSDINNVPKIDYELCNGCGLCMRVCPGLAIFMMDARDEKVSRISIPYEYADIPEAGREVEGLDACGNSLGFFKVITAEKMRGGRSTTTLTLEGPYELTVRLRNINCKDE